MNRFALMETTVTQVHKAYLSGELSCRALCEAYLARIHAYDKSGPAVNSIICINPKALEEADRMDAYIKEHGTLCGPLHGIPIMLKDNFNTSDLPTTAGSIALLDWVPPTDAFVVERLRKAGALILAKTNLHEFAIWGETVSSVLGASVNPYDLTRTPGGSSGGTGAAIACNFGIIGLGTDTINSIRSPASANSLVGIRPTMSMVSRTGIVPYSLTQDIAGPICRTVEDAVRCLDVIAGYDPKDSETAFCVGQKEESYLGHLKLDGMKNARIGVLKSLFGREKINQSTNIVLQNAMKVFEENEATLVPIDENIDQVWLTKEASVHLDDFAHDLDQYLRELPADWPVHSMADILESGKFHPFSESNLREAMTLDVNTLRYYKKMYNKIGVRTLVLKLMADYDLDAIIYPHQQQLVCKLGGSQQQRNGALCSATGFPSIVVPAGFAPDENAPLGVPVGMEIMGRPWSEGRLIEIAFSFEQHSRFRKPPYCALDLEPAEFLQTR